MADDITFETTNVSIVNAQGKVGSTPGSAFVYAVYTKKDGTELRSERITVKVEASTIAKIVDYTVGTTTFTDEDYKQSTTVSMGTTPVIKVQVEDQFGKKTTLNNEDPNVKFESLDLDVAVVDEATGTVTPLKEGSFAVKITVGSVSKTVELNVVEASKPAAIIFELDNDELTLSNKSAGKSVKVEVHDQFEQKLTGDKAAFTASTNSAGEKLVNVTYDASAGTVTVTPKTDPSLLG